MYTSYVGTNFKQLSFEEPTTFFYPLYKGFSCLEMCFNKSQAITWFSLTGFFGGIS